MTYKLLRTVKFVRMIRAFAVSEAGGCRKARRTAHWHSYEAAAVENKRPLWRGAPPLAHISASVVPPRLAAHPSPMHQPTSATCVDSTSTT